MRRWGGGLGESKARVVRQVRHGEESDRDMGVSRTGSSQAPLGTGSSQAPLGTGSSQAPLGTGSSQAPLGTGSSQAPLGTGSSRPPLHTGSSQAPLRMGLSLCSRVRRRQKGAWRTRTSNFLSERLA